MSDPTPAPLRLCAHCDYRLTGLEQGSLCPECGTASPNPELMLNVLPPFSSVVIFAAFWVLLNAAFFGFLTYQLPAISEVQTTIASFPLIPRVLVAAFLLVLLGLDVLVFAFSWGDFRALRCPSRQRIYIHRDGLICRVNHRTKVIPWNSGTKLRIHLSQAGYFLTLKRRWNLPTRIRLDPGNVDPDTLIRALREIFNSPDPTRPTPTVTVVARTPFLPWTPKPKPIIIAPSYPNPQS